LPAIRPARPTESKEAKMLVIPNHARLRLKEGKLSLGIVPVHDLLGVGEGLQHH